MLLQLFLNVASGFFWWKPSEGTEFHLGSHQVTQIMHKGQDLETVGATGDHRRACARARDLGV